MKKRPVKGLFREAYMQNGICQKTDTPYLTE
ncbi:hypothetical protein BSNT_07212 [Bacillus subtilis subsp. natto BEST195]|nr:hypothetical protein BSNT_07212 [Bacillus subtilis subsp. natto BEST195]